MFALENLLGPGKQAVFNWIFLIYEKTYQAKWIVILANHERFPYIELSKQSVEF